MKNKKVIATFSLVACMAVTGVAFSTIKYFIGADANSITVKSTTVSGKQDITNGLINAIKEANNGTTLVIPEGNYVLTKTVNVNKKVTIKGNGKVVIDGQARLVKNSSYTKLNKSSSKYVPEYNVENASKFSGEEVFNITSSDVTLDNLDITGVIKDSYDVVPVGIRVNEGVCNATIKNCKIHDMGSCYKKYSKEYNAHGIIVSGTSSSDSNTIKNTTIKNCELYNLKLGQSEALVLNGNVEGFDVSNNYVHDCDNIGIDIIGYEHDKSKNDSARNGSVNNNVVINISSGKNIAYIADGEGACAGGIYVDGGQNVEIMNNYVENSDIGIELASEHSGKTTSKIKVINNTLYKNNEIAGLSIGGSGSNNGGTKDCVAEYNTIYNTKEACLNFQRNCYSTNQINNNILIAADSAEGYSKDEKTSFTNGLSNNLANFDLSSLKKDSTNKKQSISFVDRVNTPGKIDFVIKTDVNIKSNGKNIYGSDVTRRESDAKTVVKETEKESESQKATKKEEKESSTIEVKETKPSVKESEKTSEKTTAKKEETTKKKEETTKKETVKETESKQAENNGSNNVVPTEEDIKPEAIISSESSFYNLEERTKGMRIKYTKKKNKENWSHVDLTFSNLDLTKYSKVKISFIPSRNGMNLGITNMDEEDPIFYRDHWKTEGKFTSTEEQTVTVNLNEDNIDGLFLYFDATKKDGSSDAQRCYITKIEFE